MRDLGLGPPSDGFHGSGRADAEQGAQRGKDAAEQYIRLVFAITYKGFTTEDVTVTFEELNPGSVEHEITRRRSDPCGCGEDKPATPTGTPRSRSVRNRRLSCMAVPLTLWGTAWGV